MKRTWFIGIDISKKTLDVAIYDQKSKKLKKHTKVSNNESGFKKLIEFLKSEDVILKEAFVCLEYCGIYGLELGTFLEGKINYRFCPPLQIIRSLGITRGKNDKLDAYKISKYCYQFRDDLSPSKMPTKTLLNLKMLLGERNRVVKASVVEKQVLKELSSHMSKETIKRTKKRLKTLKSDILTIEKEMIELIKTDHMIYENYTLLTSITGIAIVNAVMMILCTNNFKGITNARSFACYCGVAPFEHSSGTSIRGKTKVSKLSNRKMKTDITNAARSAIIHDPEMKIYYKRKMEEGKEYGSVLNAVKFKIITRAFAVVKRKTPYVKLRSAG